MKTLQSWFGMSDETLSASFFDDTAQLLAGNSTIPLDSEFVALDIETAGIKEACL